MGQTFPEVTTVIGPRPGGAYGRRMSAQPTSVASAGKSGDFRLFKTLLFATRLLLVTRLLRSLRHEIARTDEGAQLGRAGREIGPALDRRLQSKMS